MDEGKTGGARPEGVYSVYWYGKVTEVGYDLLVLEPWFGRFEGYGYVDYIQLSTR